MNRSASAPIERRSATVRCRDGWTLSLAIVAPPDPVAVVVAGHAMMVDRRTLDVRGDGLASLLAAHGLAVVVADLRGHGGSGPLAAAGGRWSYDDLVEEDAPALYAFARASFPRLPLAAVGHSLFGHVALAHAARHPEAAPDAIAAIAANLWARRWEPSARRWLEKRIAVEASVPVVRALGRLPVRRLGLGNTDEAAAYWMQMVDWTRANDWRARDGFSYAAALCRVPCPVLAVAGAGDRLFCHPEAMRRFVARLPRVTVEVVGRATGLPRDPDHMALVTDPACRPVWERVARFLVEEARAR